MGAGPKTAVPAPLVAPPRVGLLVSAATPPSGEGSRWINGITFDPETGQTGYITDVCEPTVGDRDLPDRPALVEWEPYIVGDGLKCSSLGSLGRDWRAQVRRQANATAEFQISQELWTGTLARAQSHGNRYLNDSQSETVTTVASDPIDALGCLEDYLATTLGGQRGMIHATRSAVTWWTRHGLISRDGGLLVTALDTIVVPGAGYDGSGPRDEGGSSATGVWAYATGMVEVRRGDYEIFGDPETQAASLDRDTNSIEVRAEQPALASWDGIAHGAAEIDIDPCAVLGS